MFALNLSLRFTWRPRQLFFVSYKCMYLLLTVTYFWLPSLEPGPRRLPKSSSISFIGLILWCLCCWWTRRKRIAGKQSLYGEEYGENERKRAGNFSAAWIRRNAFVKRVRWWVLEVRSGWGGAPHKQHFLLLSQEGRESALRPSIVQLQREFINLLKLYVCGGVVKLVGSYFLINLLTYLTLHMKWIFERISSNINPHFSCQ